MLIDFFFTLKDAKIPVTIKEFLTLLEAMERNVIATSMDDFSMEFLTIAERNFT